MKEKTGSKAQSERFSEAARKLGCDEDPGHFDEILKKVARHKPTREVIVANKEKKTEEEIKALVDAEIKNSGTWGTQFIKVVPENPEFGANWRIAHSGPWDGDLSETIERVYEKLKKLYDMR